MTTLLPLLLFLSGAPPPGWSEPATAATGTDIRQVRAAVSGREVVVAYVSGETARRSAWIRRSRDGGRSFASPVGVPLRRPLELALAVGEEKDLYLAATSREKRDALLLFHSSDGGRTWAKTEIGSERSVYSPSILVSGGYVFLCWGEADVEGSDVRVAVGRERQTVFDSRRVSGTGARAFLPRLAGHPGELHVVWQERSDDGSERIFAATSRDRGRTFSEALALGGGHLPAAATWRSVGVVYLSEEEGRTRLRFRDRRPGADGFEEPVEVVSRLAGISASAVALCRETAYVAWCAHDGESETISVTARGLAGFREPVHFVPRRRPARYPALAADRSSLLLFWREGEGKKTQIRFTRADTTVASPMILDSGTRNGWVSKREWRIEWEEPEDDSGIAGYAYLLDTRRETVPDIVNARQPSAVFPLLPEGRWYFHLRAVDGAGNASLTKHVAIRVDRTPPLPPLVRSETHPEFTISPRADGTFAVECEDESGIAGYAYALDRDPATVPPGEVLFSGHVLELSGMHEGKRYLHVRALDGAGNWGAPVHYSFRVGRVAVAAFVDDTGRPTASGRAQRLTILQRINTLIRELQRARESPESIEEAEERIRQLQEEIRKLREEYREVLKRHEE